MAPNAADALCAAIGQTSLNVRIRRRLRDVRLKLFTLSNANLKLDLCALQAYIKNTDILGFMVMPRTAQRPDRISLRLSPQAKRKIERAYSDKTLTDFVVDVALQKADAIVREHEVITLSAEEWERFEALLLHPPKPNKKLKQTLAWYRQVARD